MNPITILLPALMGTLLTLGAHTYGQDGRESRMVGSGASAAVTTEEQGPTDDERTIPESVVLDVPFSTQAPYGDWGEPYGDACEEASIIMVQFSLQNVPLVEESAQNQILALDQYEAAHGYSSDLGVADTGRIAEAFYGIEARTYYDEEVTEDSIRRLLAEGHPVIVPALGKTLANPHYTNGGPTYHMVVVVGYDTTGFIVHDPWTRYGKNYRYPYETFMDAIHDWTTDHAPLESGRRAMLVLEKK